MAPTEGLAVTNHDLNHFERNVSALRGRTFDLVAELVTASRIGDGPFAAATSHLQSAANQLGAVESLLRSTGRAAA
jgi:hypothetical protein